MEASAFGIADLQLFTSNELFNPPPPLCETTAYPRIKSPALYKTPYIPE